MFVCFSLALLAFYSIKHTNHHSVLESLSFSLSLSSFSTKTANDQVESGTSLLASLYQSEYVCCWYQDKRTRCRIVVAVHISGCLCEWKDEERINERGRMMRMRAKSFYLSFLVFGFHSSSHLHSRTRIRVRHEHDGWQSRWAEEWELNINQMVIRSQKNLIQLVTASYARYDANDSR